MPNLPSSNPPSPHGKPFVERWFFTGMAIAMLATAIAGFAPAILNPTARRAPLSLLAAVHGIVFFVWLSIFLAQSLLVAIRRVVWHRRLGLASVAVLLIMIPLAFETTVAMVRRGFDLSGDQNVEPHPRPGSSHLDPYNASVFNFGDLFLFAALATAALCYRRRRDVHRRLMLFANVALMGAPVAHLIGHSPLVLTPGLVMLPIAMFLLAGVARDYLTIRRIHPLTAVLALAMFATYPIRGAFIGPSEAWHRVAAWLSQ